MDLKVVPYVQLIKRMSGDGISNRIKNDKRTGE